MRTRLLLLIAVVGLSAIGWTVIPRKKPAADAVKAADAVLIAASDLDLGEVWETRTFAHTVTLRNTTDKKAADAVLIAASDLDLGEVWETRTFAHTVTLRNTTDKPVTVATLNPSCGCTDGATERFELAAGQSKAVPVTLDLGGRCLGDEKAVRDVKLKLPLAADGSRGWTVTARVKAAIFPSRREIDLGRIPAGSAPRERTLTVKPLLDVADLTATADHNVVRVTTDRTADGWAVRVTPSLPLGPNNYRTELTLQPRLRSGEVLPPTVVPVRFDMLHEIQPDSPVVLLGTVPVGALATGRFTLASSLGRPFLVTGVTTNPADTLTATPALGPSATKTLDVDRRVTKVGDLPGRVTVAGTDANGLPFTVTVEVKVYGLGETP